MSDDAVRFAERLESAKRAAAVCPVHQTLLRAPTITTTVVKE